MVEAWQPGGFMRLWWDSLSKQEQRENNGFFELTPQEQLDRMQGVHDGRDAWWDALTPQQKLDKMQLVIDGRDAWWAALPPQEQRDYALHLPHMRDGWVSKYATAEDAREAHRARVDKRNAEVRAAGRTCRLPDPPEQEPRECKCLLPQNDFARVAPRELRKCLECCGAAAALLADQRLLPKASDDAWYPTPKSLAKAANVVTAGFEPGKSPFPRVYDLSDFTPDATKVRNKNRAKSSKSAGA
jgi:hypothetical protein